MYLSYFSNRGRSKILHDSGQIIIEYVLLLVVAVVIATMLTSLLVSRNAEEPGVITGKWQQLLQVIANDAADNPEL